MSPNGMKTWQPYQPFYKHCFTVSFLCKEMKIGVQLLSLLQDLKLCTAVH